tara:strand:- start:868 stop:4068 length:3201 start_codon:yes stop_codon:yes gene_type:complete
MASYGKIRETTISGQAGTTWYVELWKKDYTGSVTDITLKGEGFTVNWSGQGGTRDKQFIKSESVLSMYVQNSTDEDLIYDIFSKGDRSYYTRIYKNGQTKSDIWWFGWVNPSFCTIENSPFPYNASIKSTDSIGTFSKKEESVLEASAITTTHRINSHIKDFGDTMGLYNAPTELVLDGNFPDPNVNWDIESAWSIPSGGGRIDYDASAVKYIRTDVNITAGNEYAISFNISNLIEGGTAKITFRVNSYPSNSLFDLAPHDYTSNGNYTIKGVAQNTATKLFIYGLSVGDSYSLTNFSLVDGLDTNISPCPTNNDWFQTSVDWWRSGDTYQSDDPFYLYRTTKAAYRGDKEQKPRNYKEYDVLKGALKTFNTNCILSNGKYNFIQPNNWLENTNGILPFYSYSEGGDNRDTTSVSENNLVSINGSTTVGNGAILAGSNLTFEPAFKGVDATFISGAVAVEISPTVDFTTFQTVGQVEASVSNSFMYLKMNLRHYETLLITAVDAALGTGYSLRNNLIRTDFAIEIRVINGSTTYYVRKFGNEHIWQTAQAELEKKVGRGLEGWSSLNGVDYNYPCSISKGTTHYTAKSENQFIPFFPQPPISGDLQIKVTGVNTYNKYLDGGSSYGIPFPVTSAFELTEENLLASGSELVNTSTTSQSSDEIGITYSSTQNENSAEEQFDLGDIIVGNSSATNINEAILYTVSYGDSIPATSGFRRGGGTGIYSNITQLLANEFLKPQIEPLTILQAEIFSPSVNPTSLLKYSINDDTSYNYYTFLGGVFSAQSETMSGEWYKINDSASITIEEAEVKMFSPSSDTQVNQNNLEFFSNTNKANVSSDSLAITSVAIVAANSTTSISVGSSLKSDVAENQKLKLTYPDGSNGITITVTDGYNDSATSLNVSSFDSIIDYPIGSILSVTPYEAVSLIQRLTTSGNANFRSVGVNNIQEMNFLPQDFILTTSHNVSIVTEDLGGSVKSHPLGLMYAQKLISKGKTITKVNVFGSANFGFRVYEGFIFNDTTTLVGTGTANTELDINDIVGTSRNYITIEVTTTATTEEVYGGYALVTNT